MKKRFIAICMTALMAVSMLAGCGSSSDESSSASSVSSASSAEEESSTSEASSASSTSGDEAAAEDLTIAFIPKTLNNPFFVAIRDAIQAGCDERGWTLECNAADAETEVDKQVSIVEAFIQEGVDAIILGPSDRTSLIDTINSAAENGIPVFLVDSGSDEADFVSFVGTDNYVGGQVGAQWVGENIKSGQVAILDGYAGNDATTQRYQGFMDEIANYPDIEVVDSQYGNCEIAQGMSVTENFLTAYPDLACIFAVNDMMAIGAGQAVQAADKRDQVTICGFDGQPDAAQAIIDGTIDATIAQKPATMGTTIVEQVEAYFAGEEIPENTDTGCDVVTAENAETYLEWQ